MRLEIRSIAEAAIQDSSSFAVAIEVQRVGRACFTTVSYTPGADDFASDARMSVKIERKMGSSNDIVSCQAVPLLCLLDNTPLLFFVHTSRVASTSEFAKSVVSHDALSTSSTTDIVFRTKESVSSVVKSRKGPRSWAIRAMYGFNAESSAP